MQATEASTTPDATTAKSGRRAAVRTCAGCGASGAPDEMVRVVLGPEGQVAVDLAGGAFGRGAHVHASPACVRKAAPRGLARSFRAEVKVTPEELAREVALATAKRVAGLLASAIRSKHVATGADAVTESVATEAAELVVVAGDAGAVATSGAVRHAVAEGRAVGWGTKAILGDLSGRASVAVLAVTSRRLADAIRQAVAAGDAIGALVTRESTEAG